MNSLFISIFLFSIATVIYNVMTFAGIVREKDLDKNRLDKCLNWCMVFVGLGSIAFVAFGYSLYYQNMSTQQAYTHEDTKETTAGVHIPKITEDRDMGLLGDVKLNKDNWDMATEEEKNELINTVAHIEGMYLNVSVIPEIEIVKMEKGSLGNYCQKSGIISVSEEHLRYSSMQEVIRTVCHEMFHVFQEELYDAYRSGYIDDSVVKRYAEEFDNYIDAEKDFYAYYEQKCEKDARGYAEEATRLYMIEL